jgi:hypothetical protein
LHARPHCGSTVHHWRRRRLLLSSLDSRSDVRLLEIGDSDADAELLPLDSGAVGPESLVFSGDRDGHACASYHWALVVFSAAHGWVAGVASTPSVAQ